MSGWVKLASPDMSQLLRIKAARLSFFFDFFVACWTVSGSSTPFMVSWRVESQFLQPRITFRAELLQHLRRLHLLTTLNRLQTVARHRSPASRFH